MKVEDLRVGGRYVFRHRRKGVFTAELRGFARGDGVDEVLLECMIDTSDAPRLARTKGAVQTLTNVRPSLLVGIEVAPGYVPPVEQVASTGSATVKGWISRLFKRLGG